MSVQCAGLIRFGVVLRPILTEPDAQRPGVRLCSLLSDGLVQSAQAGSWRKHGRPGQPLRQEVATKEARRRGFI